MQRFPANPSDGTVFEMRRGVYYVYESSTRSWVKVAGSGRIFPLATPTTAGLMSAADLKKVNRVLVPMPSSTIKGEACTGRFISGHIGLYSADDYLKVTGEPLIANAGVGGNYPFRISRNTAGFNFTIDKVALIADLIARGQINLVGPAGQQGTKGRTGARGGSLPTGPKGEKGDKGASPPCSLSIAPDPAPSKLRDGTNRAVVGMETRQTSDTEFELVVKMGVVGNPDAAPSAVNAGCTDSSTWALAVATTGATGQQVYYVDMSTIIETIKDKFEEELARVKKGHEDVVQFWLERMSSLFHAQKAVLCCAITACEQLNAGSAPSLLAAMGQQGVGYADGIVGNPADEPVGGPAEEPAELLGGEVDDGPPADGGMMGVAMARPVAVPTDFTITVDGLTNTGSDRQAVALDVPAGYYVAEIIGCCIRSGDEYVGDAVITYNAGGQEGRARFIRPGRYVNARAAERAYSGLTLEIGHHGGLLRCYLPSSMLQDVSGSMMVRLTRRNVDLAAPAGPPGCALTADELARHGEAVADGSVRSFVARVSGQDYIVFDVLPECRCVRGDGLSLAWPTFDGQTFVKMPGRGPFQFRPSDAMSGAVARIAARSGGHQHVMFPVV